MDYEHVKKQLGYGIQTESKDNAIKALEQLQAKVAELEKDLLKTKLDLLTSYGESEELLGRIAELEAENAKLHEQVDLQVPKTAFTQLKEQLDASQAYAEQLREALTTCVCAMQDYQAGIGITEMFDKGERLGRKALAIPASTEALDKSVEELGG